jgi:hypothetical protein
MSRFNAIFMACVRIAQVHWKPMLKPTGLLFVATFITWGSVSTAALVAVLSGTEVLQGPGFWPFAMALMFCGRVFSAPIEIWWLKRLQACMRGEPEAIVKVGIGEMVEAIILESVRGPLVLLGMMMCIIPGLLLRPMLFLPESALASGYRLKDAAKLSIDLIRTRFRELVTLDFLVVIVCGAISFLPLVGPLLVLPSLLLGRYVLWLDLSGTTPAEQVEPDVPPLFG